MTTYEKVTALAEHIRTLNPAELAPELAPILEGAQILKGLGIKIPNPLDFLLPADPAEADVAIDKMISLLFELRGDDLPPFDPNQYGEGLIADYLGRLG